MMSHWREFMDLAAPSGRYVSWKEVARRTSLSRTTAWRLQKREEFPRPYAISLGRVAYREDEVEAWRKSRDLSPARSRRIDPPQRGGSRSHEPATSPAPEAVSDASEATAPQAASLETRAPLAPPQPGRLPKRRRSQHAEAIARQILFDF